MTKSKTDTKTDISDMRLKKQRVKTAKRRKSGSTKWLARQLNDPYVVKARSMGYKSRAAFKLLHINEKYNLIKAGHKIIDLGCAPGGWLQVCTNVLKGNGKIVGIDLLKMDDIEGAIVLQGDFNHDLEKDNIIQVMAAGKVNGVLSDMASNTIGHKKTDHIRIIALVEMAAHFAFEVLDKDGYFVAKVFSGGTENNLLNLLKQKFNKVYHYKPPSSRKDSAEMYVIAIGFKEQD